MADLDKMPQFMKNAAKNVVAIYDQQTLFSSFFSPESFEEDSWALPFEHKKVEFVRITCYIWSLFYTDLFLRNSISRLLIIS